MLSDNFGLTLLLGADLTALWIALAAVIALAIGIAGGYLVYRYVARKSVGTVKQECEKIKSEANAEAKTILKEAKVEAKEEQQRLRAEIDRENKERKAEIARNEQRLMQREDQLVKREVAIDKKSDYIEEKKKQIEQKQQKIDALQEELEGAHAKIVEELEKVAGMTQSEAKQMLIDELVEDAKKDAEVKVREIEQQAKEEADKKAKNIVGLAIQRCAVDHASEICTSVVALPNEEMKGRLIGRVGRISAR